MKEIVRPRRLSQQDVLRLASHLTDRDRWIARDCFELRVLTTSQIRRLYFTGTRTAAARLDVLYRLRVLDRFRPSLPIGQGTAPYHWILDEAGALIVADHLDIERSKLGWQHSIAASIAHSQAAPPRRGQRVLHPPGRRGERRRRRTVGVDGERTCHHLFSGHLFADGYGVLDLPGRAPLHFLVELDRGTETNGRLREKAAAYTSILPTSSLGKLDPFVLLVVPSAKRAASVTAALAYSPAPIAVAVWNKDCTSAVLAIVVNARERLWQSQPAAAREGLRSGAGSDLLGPPKDHDSER